MAICSRWSGQSWSIRNRMICFLIVNQFLHTTAICQGFTRWRKWVFFFSVLIYVPAPPTYFLSRWRIVEKNRVLSSHKESETNMHLLGMLPCQDSDPSTYWSPFETSLLIHIWCWLQVTTSTTASVLLFLYLFKKRFETTEVGAICTKPPDINLLINHSKTTSQQPWIGRRAGAWTKRGIWSWGQGHGGSCLKSTLFFLVLKDIFGKCP